MEVTSERRFFWIHILVYVQMLVMKLEESRCPLQIMKKGS